MAPERGDCRHFDSTSLIQITECQEPLAAKQQRALCRENLYSPTHNGNCNDDAGDGQGVLQGR